jgi:hypothetical protein
MGTDKQGAFVHFQRRCRERFGISLNDQETEQIGQLCHDGSYFKILDQYEGVGLYRVRMGKEMAAIAYDRNRETVLTIMPIAWTSRSHKIERARMLADAELQIGKSP